MNTSININRHVIINGIDFYIKEIEQNQLSQTFMMNKYVLPSQNEIRIIAETSVTNMLAINNWFNQTIGYAKTYKHDLISNYINIFGIFPINYTYSTNNIDITFSADHYNYDYDYRILSKEQLKKERKEKLDKLAEICQKSS